MIFGLVLAIIAASIYRWSAQQAQATGHIKTQNDFVDVKNFILSNFDCLNSVTPTPPQCDGNREGYFELKDMRNRVLVGMPDGQQGPTKVGNGYRVRAKCFNCPACPGGKNIIIEVAKMEQSGQFAQSKLSGKELKWKDLLEGIPIGCSMAP